MKHQFFFSGYSDDVVLAGRDKRTFDEHYATYYLLSNGVAIKADHGSEGWIIAPTTLAECVTIIPAADVDDDGTDHTDPRLPEWLRDGAPGYAPVLIIESDESLEIVAKSDDPFADTSPEFIAAAKLRAAVIKASNCDEYDECPAVEHFKAAIRALGIKI